MWLPAPTGLVNRRRSGRPRQRHSSLLVDSTPGREPLQRWRKLTFLFRSSNNVAFKMLLTLHNSTHGALHTRLWGSASKLWPLWRGRQHVVRRARWMEMSSPQWQVHTDFFIYLFLVITCWSASSEANLHTYISPQRLADSRRTQKFVRKVRKVVSAPVIFSMMPFDDCCFANRNMLIRLGGGNRASQMKNAFSWHAK